MLSHPASAVGRWQNQLGQIPPEFSNISLPRRVHFGDGRHNDPAVTVANARRGRTYLCDIARNLPLQRP
jgi:hypothetical protein